MTDRHVVMEPSPAGPGWHLFGPAPDPPPANRQAVYEPAAAGREVVYEAEAG